MSLYKSLLGVTFLSLALASTPVHAGPSAAGRDQLANKVATALLVLGIGAKGYETFNDTDISTQHLPRKLTTMLTGLLAFGKIGDAYHPGVSKMILHGVLGSLLIAGMLPNANKFAKMPGIKYFAKGTTVLDPTPHHLRIINLILMYELAKHGAVWAADKLGYTSVPEPVNGKKGRK